MGIITPTNEEVLSFRGVHLYHSGISNCSMRVRMVLEEKGVPWKSHHFNLLAKEHITPEYFGINPNGLVPTLVHDGVVIIESDDIVDYLDDTFPLPALKPNDEADRAAMYYWLRKAVEIHVKAVKTYIYAKRVGKNMAHDTEEDERYRNLQANPELLEFHRRSTTTGFSAAEVDSASGILHECFKTLDTRLANGQWIAGNQYSLADIAWIPLHFTLERLAGFSFEQYANLHDWAERLAARESFKKGVIDYWPSDMGVTR